MNFWPDCGEACWNWNISGLNSETTSFQQHQVFAYNLLGYTRYIAHLIVLIPILSMLSLKGYDVCIITCKSFSCSLLESGRVGSVWLKGHTI